MGVAYLDTQVVVWLHTRRHKKLTRAAVRLIESRDLLLSPMAYLELEYIRRLGRVKDSPATIFANLAATIGVSMCSIPFSTVALKAVGAGWTTDPFDVIIVAQARANADAPLITSDERILEHYPQAVW